MRDSPIAYTIRTPENFYILIALYIQIDRITVKRGDEIFSGQTHRLFLSTSADVFVRSILKNGQNPIDSVL